jgi:hypothetical protein
LLAAERAHDKSSPGRRNTLDDFYMPSI